MQIGAREAKAAHVNIIESLPKGDSNVRVQFRFEGMHSCTRAHYYTASLLSSTPNFSDVGECEPNSSAASEEGTTKEKGVEAQEDIAELASSHVHMPFNFLLNQAVDSMSEGTWWRVKSKSNENHVHYLGRSRDAWLAHQRNSG